MKKLLTKTFLTERAQGLAKQVLNPKQVLNFLPLLPILGIIAIVLILFFTNYQPGTFLTGWDNLHPEFDLSLNLKRSVFSVWQEYQGLGLLAGMGHASDLIHVLELSLVSLVLKPDLLRYAYHFAMVFLGMLGMYLLLQKFFLKGYSRLVSTLGSTIGSLFYVFNFGTIQYFYVPFEPYSTFFGFMPLLVYTLFSYFQKPDKKTLLLFVAINILATPLAYVQTIFLVYFMCAFLIAGIFTVFGTTFTKTIRIRLAITTISIILAVNAFWLLPNAYFTLKNVSVTQNAMQSKMATEKFFQMNKNRGTIPDLIFLREFYYDFTDLNNKTGSFDFLMKSWREHTSTLLYQIISLILFAVAVLGIVTRNQYRKYLLVLAGLSAFMFLSDTPVLAQLNSFLRTTPLLAQIFRNPFTKFIVPLVFVYAVGMGIGISYILARLSKRSYIILTTLLVAFLIILNVLPVFQGQFVSPSMRNTIPKEYFDVFAYFKSHDSTSRIMNLPQDEYWGWEYYNWGYHGSGFLWYGIEQPIMDRAFDVWSPSLESYYWQLSYALKSRDKKLFNQILTKYNVGYILFDNNLLSANNRYASRAELNQEEFLLGNPLIESHKIFGNITIYKTKLSNKINNNISFYDSALLKASSKDYQYVDPAFSTLPYASTKNGSQYPFASLFTDRFQDENLFTVEERKDSLVLKTTIAAGDHDLSVPSLIQAERLLPTEIFARRTGNSLILRFNLLVPQLFIDGKAIPVTVPYQEITLPLSSKAKSIIVDVNNVSYLPLDTVSDSFTLLGRTHLINEDTANSIQVYDASNPITYSLLSTGFAEAKECGTVGGKTEFSSKAEVDAIRLTAKNTSICASYNAVLLSTNTLIKASFEYKSATDEFPQYCIYSDESRKCLNKKDAVLKGYSNSFARFDEYFENNNPSDSSTLNLILDATRDEDREKPKSILYKNVYLTSYPALTGAPLSFSTLIDANQIAPISIVKDSQIQLVIPKIDDIYSYSNAITRRAFKKSPLDYNQLVPGLVQKDPPSNDRAYVRLTAQNASSYLLTSGSILSPGQAYLAKITARTVTGMAPTVDIFTNKNSVGYTYTMAKKSSDFADNYFILPPLYEFDQGISILTGSSSYNRSKTITDIKDISFTTIPYKYIASIAFTQAANTTPIEISSTKNTHEIWRYTALVPSNAETMILSQAFDSGWAAYSVDSANWLNKALPFLFGKQLSDHIKVNNWENGWSGLSDSDGQTVIIVYLPQYLEYVGFVLLGGTLLYLIFGTLRPRKASS